VGTLVSFKGNSTYCFTFHVAIPDGCTQYCCNQADLRKFEVRSA
jgi:hypothetical protein